MPKYAEFQAFREQNLITEADGDMLHREARALALRRIEESARTEEDFREVMDAVNVGLAAMHKAPAEELKESVLGFMTALPTTAEFITYESVYLPKNHFIKEETLPTEDYLACFYPFEKPDFQKNGVESGWSVTDRDGIAVTMAIAAAMGNVPQAVAMEHQREYAERYDWIVKEFTDLAFTFVTGFLYYLDYDSIDEDTRSLYRQGISAFGGVSPTYRIALGADAPVQTLQRKPLSQAGKGTNFAARSARTSLMSTNRGKRRKTKSKILFAVTSCKTLSLW